MVAANFTETELAGGSEEFSRTVREIKDRYGFDFVSMGLTAFIGAPLKWVYSAGATGERYRRIVLVPGRGIGGIVVKAGKPMMFVDIDEQIDPREYSSYPIVFAEDLHSFCAFPLERDARTVGALLCAFRSVSDRHEQVYAKLADDLDGTFCNLDIVTSDFIDLARIAAERRSDSLSSRALGHSELSRIIAAQEDERRRISRELHDGVAQEMLSVSFLLERLEPYVRHESAACSVLAEIRINIDQIMDDLHNLSVQLRPSALDHLGLVSALRSRAALFEKTFGVVVELEDEWGVGRFDRSLETQTYRICQEAILNACKYSESDMVTVSFEKRGDWLRVCVEDFGCGFDVERSVIQGSGCGISGMRERAHLIGATLEITSSDAGTKVVLVAPLQVQEAACKGETDDS